MGTLTPEAARGNGIAEEMPGTRNIGHPDDILFDNRPLFDRPGDHFLPREDRGVALQQHRAFEHLLSLFHDDQHHWALTGEHAMKPRQTIAYLVVKFCLKNHTPLAELLDAITKLGGEVSDPALLGSRKSDKKAIVNLLSLDDEVLWQLYMQLPARLVKGRPEKPRMPVDPMAPKKKQKRRIGFDGKLQVPKKAKPAPAQGGNPSTTYRQVCWACCDICDKWRRVPGSEADLSDTWRCIDHPSGCITCETPEENVEEDEKWNGEIAGVPQPTAEELAEAEMLGEESDSESAQASTSEMPASQGPSEEGVGDDEDEDDHADGIDDADLWGNEDDEY